MRPLGLEGKVGAPAIIRENPVLKRYRRFVRENSQTPFASWDLNGLARTQGEIASWGPFSWPDVVDTIGTEYSGGRNTALEYLIECASASVDDSLLLYPLDTPDMYVHLMRGKARHRIAVLQGSCAGWSCWPDVNALIRGRANRVEMSRGVVVVEDEVHDLSLHRGSIGVVSDAVSASIKSLFTGRRSLTLSPRLSLQYSGRGLGAVCTPSETHDIRSLSLRIFEHCEDPVALDTIHEEFLNRRFAFNLIPYALQSLNHHPTIRAYARRLLAPTREVLS